MSYINEIDRLGGLEKLRPSRNTNLNIEDIRILEKDLGTELPGDLSDFLMNYGISHFSNEITFDPISRDSEYIHHPDSGQPNFFFEGSGISVFHGRDREETSAHDIFWNAKNYKDRMPPQFLPFASDGMGNQIVISLHKETYGRIYFWDHETEWDAEDYEDEVGVAMPEEVKYQNLWLLANDFNDFFRRLQVE